MQVLIICRLIVKSTILSARKSSIIIAQPSKLIMSTITYLRRWRWNTFSYWKKSLKPFASTAGVCSLTSTQRIRLTIFVTTSWSVQSAHQPRRLAASCGFMLHLQYGLASWIAENHRYITALVVAGTWGQTDRFRSDSGRHFDRMSNPSNWRKLFLNFVKFWSRRWTRHRKRSFVLHKMINVIDERA